MGMENRDGWRVAFVGRFARVGVLIVYTAKCSLYVV